MFAGRWIISAALIALLWLAALRLASAQSPPLASVRQKIDAVESADAAVEIWRQYLATKPSPGDAQYAKNELAKWTARANDGAEKINGVWVAGDERRALLASAADSYRQAIALLQNNETLHAVKKLEESQRIYPRSFTVNYLLGYIAFSQDNMDKALSLFESAQRLRPDSAETAANIGLVYFKQKRYEEGIRQVEHAAEMADTPDIAYSLNVVIDQAPDDLKRSKDLRPAVEAANLLASKYALQPDLWKRGILPVPPRQSKTNDADDLPVNTASGTGFIINADGLILTNRHVVKGGKTIDVLLQGGVSAAGEIVAIDDEQDLALVRIKTSKPLKCIEFCDRDSARDGAECTVIGYPLGQRFSSAPKVTHGIVTSSKTTAGGADLMIDAKVNPGNSGGPILDSHGHVMAIVCMKSVASRTEESYGLGISAGKIRKFLQKNEVKIQKESAGAKHLSVEAIAAKVEPMTVLIVTRF